MNNKQKLQMTAIDTDRRKLETFFFGLSSLSNNDNNMTCIITYSYKESVKVTVPHCSLTHDTDTLET